MPWFVKLEEGIVEKPAFDAVVPEHLAWLRTLEAAGHQPSSGYWGDRKGQNGHGAGGMLLFQAASLQEAEVLVRQDPLIRHGCVRWTLHEWHLVHVAGATLRSGTAAPDLSSTGETLSPPG